MGIEVMVHCKSELLEHPVHAKSNGHHLGATM